MLNLSEVFNAINMIIWINTNPNLKLILRGLNLLAKL